jgi:hypothetical protein
MTTIRKAMKRVENTLIALAIIAALATPGSGRAETGVVVVGESYERNRVHRALLGDGYRDLWNTPIEVEILHLEEAGLRPVERVGSNQTYSLALVGADGRAYTFRSLDKDASRLLPFWMGVPPWTFIFRDQTSAGLPGATLVAQHFAEAIGSLETRNRLVILAGDPALGEFRETFEGLVGTLQEYPTAKGVGPGTFGAIEIVSTGELFERFSRNGRDRPDPRAYLRARILDLWIGDWDRHADQIRWARLPSSELWQPLPEDHDGAFARYEGALVRSIDADRLVRFDHEYPESDGLYSQARNLDTWVLAGLDRGAWEEEIRFVSSRIGDEVVDEAIARLPDAWQQKRGAFLKERLGPDATGWKALCFGSTSVSPASRNGWVRRKRKAGN